MTTETCPESDLLETLANTDVEHGLLVAFLGDNKTPVEGEQWVERIDPGTPKDWGVIVDITATRIRVKWNHGSRTWLAKDAEGKRWIRVEPPAV